MNAVQEQVKELVGGVCSLRRGIGDAGGKRLSITKGMFTSATDLWETPQAFFDQLNAEFCFTRDTDTRLVNL